MPPHAQAENAVSLLSPIPAQGAKFPDEAHPAASAARSLEAQILDRFLDKLESREGVSATGLDAIRNLIASGMGIRKDSVLQAVTDAAIVGPKATDDRMSVDEMTAPQGAGVSVERASSDDTTR